MAPTHINFSDVSAATVPDGTTATAANMGLDSIVNQSGTAVWGTDADGRRYVEGSGGDRTVFFAIATPTSSYFAIEWEIEYSGTAPNSDVHSCMDLNSDGNRLIHRHRTDSTWGQKMRLQSFASGSTTAGDSYDRSSITKGYIEFGRKHWFGNFGYKHASNGFLGLSINGQARAQYENIDTESVSWASMVKFDPMDGASLTWRVYGVRYWTTDDFLEEMAPDWSGSQWEYQFIDQIGPVYGPWEVTSGAGTFETDTGGLTSNESRVRCATTVTLEMRSGHAFGQLESFRGRAVIRDEFICIPASGSYDLRIGTSSAGDIGIIAFDGTSGTSTTRPIKIGGVATGLVYEDSEPYCLDIIFDETTNKSALVLTHIGSSGATDRRQWGVWWERTGGIPAVNVITRTVIGTNAAVGMMLAAPSVDYVYPSSYMTTNSTLDSPLNTVSLEHANHIGREFDMSPDPALGYHKGILSNTSIGRSGNRMINLTDWTGAFDSLQYLRAQRFVFPEQCINDFVAGQTPAQIVAAFQLQVDACVAHGVRMWGGSQLLLPEPGYDDDYRADMDEVNTGIRLAMRLAGRKDLFKHSDVRGQYADQTAMDAVFSGGDGLHPTNDGSAEWAEYFLSVGAPIGSGLRSRDRSRER